MQQRPVQCVDYAIFFCFHEAFSRFSLNEVSRIISNYQLEAMTSSGHQKQVHLLCCLCCIIKTKVLQKSRIIQYK